MTKSEVEKLKELRNIVTMENTSFRNCLVEPQTQFGETEKKTVFEKTRVWRETWIYPLLDKLIEKYDK